MSAISIRVYTGAVQIQFWNSTPTNESQPLVKACANANWFCARRISDRTLSFLISECVSHVSVFFGSGVLSAVGTAMRERGTRGTLCCGSSKSMLAAGPVPGVRGAYPTCPAPRTWSERLLGYRGVGKGGVGRYICSQYLHRPLVVMVGIKALFW